MKGRQVYLIRGLLGAGGRHLSWFVVWLIAEQSFLCVGESVGVLWNACRVGRCLYHVPDDYTWGAGLHAAWMPTKLTWSAWYRRRCWCWSILTVGSTIQLVRIWKTVVWLWFGRWPYNDLVEVPRPVVVWEVVSWRDGLLWIVLDW